jgi:hypothetical protein
MNRFWDFAAIREWTGCLRLRLLPHKWNDGMEKREIMYNIRILVVAPAASAINQQCTFDFTGEVAMALLLYYSTFAVIPNI